MIYLLWFCVVLGGVHCQTKGPTLHIPDGEIEGVYSKSYKGNDYMGYLGIPYAAPPVGDLRFKDPVAVKPWTGIKITKESTVCLQVLHTSQPVGGKTQGTEDCLHLNVFIPGNKINATANLDVIFFIHGGAFMYGESSYGGPKFLMDREVILVTVNYRVGIFGFLSTGGKHLPGNYGLKDQVLAMEWTRKNIKHFGGNPDSITINGFSAGGASVHYHTLSPLSRGLFARAISTGGCALNPWALEKNPWQKTKIVAKEVNCLHDDTEELVKCLTKQKPEVLVEATRALRSWMFNPFSPIGPVVDSSSDNPFLPDYPYTMMLNRKVNNVPWLVSYSEEEGLYPAAELWENKSSLQDLNVNWNKYAPDILHYRDVVPEKYIDIVSAKIRNHYLPKKIVELASFHDLVQMFSDRLYLADMSLAQFLHARANTAPVYGYVFDYILESRMTFHELFTNVIEKLGTGHGDDFLLVYSPNLGYPLGKLSQSDEKAKDLMLDIFLTFAKTGKLTKSNWHPICRQQCGVNDNMLIGPDLKMKMRKEYNMGERSFWRSLPLAENLIMAYA